MRIKALSIRNALPIQHFEAKDLSDVVVLAGPNGVGKTRLIETILGHLRGASTNPDISGVIEATSKQEQTEWGKTELDMSQPTDMDILRTNLQHNRRRSNLTSTVLNFESDRTIQNVQPFAFSWDLPDPLTEEMGWDFSLAGWKNRWQDTIHSLFRLIEHQKQGIASRAVELRRQGKTEMKLSFSDPMDSFKNVFSQLLAPKELVDPSARQQTLQYRLGDQVFDISTLSSGEREVVNIAFDFLLRRPQHCVVFFDEPELHLHPELSYRLIQALQTIGVQNQFILSTHSPDIITASLDRSVIFLSPPRELADGTPANQAIPVNENDETNEALRLLGHSVGIIALGKKILLVEGENSSLDKQAYGAITRNRYPSLVLVPSGGKHLIQSFDLIHKSVLNKTLWGVEFFMLCDGDSAPADNPAPGGADHRLRILPRYHLENYFLDEDIWKEVFAEMETGDSWLLDPKAIRQRLREQARSLVSYATALHTASSLRMEAGNVDVMPKDCHDKSLADVQQLLVDVAKKETVRLGSTLDAKEVTSRAADYYNQLTKSLDDDSEVWKSLIPGKPLVSRFAAAAGLHASRAKSLYIRRAHEVTENPFQEILDIFEEFSAAE